MIKKTISSILLTTVLITLFGACASSQVKAARRGDLESLQEFLDDGGNINESEKDGITLLMYAAQNGQNEAISFLLNRGATISLRDSRGYTAFLYAVTSRYESSAELLLSRGAAVNHLLSTGDSALILASGSENLSMVKMLLARGADLNQSNNSGWSALTIALSKDAQRASNLSELTRHLISKNAKLSIHSDVVSKIAFSAAASGNVDVINYLLDLGFDREVKDSAGWSLLMKSLYQSAAGGEGPNPVALLLMEYGALPEGGSTQGAEIAFTAAENGAPEILEILMAYGLSPIIRDDQSNTLLMAGIKHPDVVKLMLDKNISVNEKNQQSMTALLLASQLNQKDSLTLLILAGADLNQSDATGRNALFYTARLKDVEMSRKLLVAGISVYAVDKNGNTALHAASEAGVPDTVRLLLTAGIYVDSSNAQGETPLMASARNPQYADEIRQILITAGAKVPVEEVAPVVKPVHIEKTPVQETPVATPIAVPVVDPTESQETSTELSIRYGWPSINPSAVQGWNNSDKLAGYALLKIGSAGSSGWFYQNQIQIPMKGVNADSFKQNLSSVVAPGGDCRALLTLPTKKGNALVAEIMAVPDQNGRVVLYFDSFSYEK
ncbi:ankyrin repeat domain-containing protein [Oceanispirochaeta crateris]|nr:ankyrin repeat domain-containing protein [Oceanispirochaeta crateris]